MILYTTLFIFFYPNQQRFLPPENRLRRDLYAGERTNGIISNDAAPQTAENDPENQQKPKGSRTARKASELFNNTKGK